MRLFLNESEEQHSSSKQKFTRIVKTTPGQTSGILRTPFACLNLIYLFSLSTVLSIFPFVLLWLVKWTVDRNKRHVCIAFGFIIRWTGIPFRR